MLAKNKTWLLAILKISIAIILFYLLIHSAQINVKLLATLLQQPFLFFEVIVFFLIMIVIGAWRWYLLNSARGIYIGFYKSFFATYIGSAFNNLLPSSVGGDVVRLFYIFKQAPQKKSEAMLSLFSDRVLGFFGIFVLIFFVALTNIHALSQQPRVFYLFLFCITFCLSLLGGFLFFIWITNRFQLSVWLRKHIGHYSWSSLIISFLNTLSIFRLEKMVMIKGLALSVIIQLLMTVNVMLIAKMMGFPSIAFTNFILAVGIIQIVNLIPLTPGGMGIGELAFANVLLILNPGINTAYATVFFAYRLINLLTYLPCVIYFIPQLASTTTSTIQYKTHGS